jgi:hypothetical protein
MVSPIIEIEEDVFAEMQRQAVPLIDTPDSLLRRLLGMSAPRGEGGQPRLAGPRSSSPRQHDRVSRTDLTMPSHRSSALDTRREARRAKPKRERAATGSIAPESVYKRPILDILIDKGGRAPKREVLDELGVRISSELLPADHEMMGNEERWRKRAQFVRLAFVKQGLMKADSPRGLWEISDAGRELASVPGNGS